MKTLFASAVILFAVAISAPSLHAQQAEQTNSKLIAERAQLVKLPGEYAFTEGPAVDKSGNVFFTDKPNDKIYKWATDGTVSVFMEHAGRSNGMDFDRDGNLITCAEEDNQLWKIDKNKNVTILVLNFEGKRLNGPNDVWVAPTGGMYFTDPFYKPKGSARVPEQEQQRVYYLAPDLTKVSIAADGLVSPNGIVGSSDGKIMYVADIRDKKIYSYRVNADATLSERKLFAPVDSDGMALDVEGNLYVTNKAGVTVFDSSGHQIENIPVPEPWTANVAFAGKDMRTLFITASKAVYTLQMRVRGQ